MNMLVIPSHLPVLKVQNTSQLPPGTPLSPGARAVLEPNTPMPEFLQTLQTENLPYDMVEVLAYSLPEREAVFWGATCSDSVFDELEPTSQEALEAAKKWVAEPSPKTGQEALQAAKADVFPSPGGWLAHAAAFSEGEACCPGQMAMDSSSCFPAAAVAGAILLSARIRADGGMAPIMEQSPGPRSMAEIKSAMEAASLDKLEQQLPLPDKSQLAIEPLEMAVPAFTPEQNEQMMTDLEACIGAGLQIAEGTLVP